MPKKSNPKRKRTIEDIISAMPNFISYKGRDYALHIVKYMYDDYYQVSYRNNELVPGTLCESKCLRTALENMLEHIRDRKLKGVHYGTCGRCAMRGDVTQFDVSDGGIIYLCTKCQVRT